MPNPLASTDDRTAGLLSDFFDNATIGLRWQARDGVVQRANRAELELLGYEEAEYVGQPVARFHADPAVAQDILQRLARGEVLHSLEAKMLCKDGSPRHVLISANVLWENGDFVHARCFTRDVTPLKAAQKALQEADRRKSAILSAALDAIITMDHQGILVDFNPAAEATFGHSRERALGRPLAELIIPPALRAAHAAGMARYLRTGEGPVLGRRVEITALHADGHEFPVELSIAVVPQVEPPLFTATLRDISQRKQSEEQLRRMLDERRQLLESERAARTAAERLSELKDQFLATLSHELRTPLSAILGWATILRKRPPTPQELQKGLDVIERNARAQTRLIEELLDTSRIASGKVPLDVQPLQPAELAQAAVESVRPAAVAKGVDLLVLPLGPLGLLRGDPHRLQQVLWNLLNNAVKFTPPGGRVTLTLGQEDETLEIAVEDTGEGIDPAFLPHVFERFRQADGSTTRQHGGLGLGLAIVRSLVELHGGSVQARSPGKGGGSRFTVRLPLLQGDTGEPATGESPAAGVRAPQLDGLRVLAVDDEPDALDLLGRILSDSGATVRLARGAAEALRMLAAEPVDVLVSDIGMPGMDGYELVRRARALPGAGGHATPAVALTAFARQEDRSRALEAGFQAYLSKPLEPARLLATIAEVARPDLRAD